jgi:hypothetical protein
MMRLKTKMALRRKGAVYARLRLNPSEPRSILLSSAAINRHCAIYLAQARRAGAFHPAGGCRMRGEP